jgi:hypothetical protein
MRKRGVSLAIVGVTLCAALHASATASPSVRAGTSPEDSGDFLQAKKIEGDLPTVPSDTRWRLVPEHKVDLLSQSSVAPGSSKVARSEISVRIMYNHHEIALLLVADDETRNDNVSAAGRFGDAIAVAFPTDYGDEIVLPYIGMGNAGRSVNIWHWKAAWQNDIDNGYKGVNESYPNREPRVGPVNNITGEAAGSPMSQTSRASPVENLVAEGFGTLTSTPTTRLKGKGTYKNGTWHVVMRRPLRPRSAGVRIRANEELLPITFAVWDGAVGERNGMKGVTRWHFVVFSDDARPVGRNIPASAFLGGADPEKGRMLVAGLGCPSCHKLPGLTGGLNIGPDLSYAGAIHRPEYLLESIIKPDAIIVPAPGYSDPATGQSTMPSFYNMRADEDDPDSPLLVTDDDFRDMASYLWSLK